VFTERHETSEALSRLKMARRLAGEIGAAFGAVPAIGRRGVLVEDAQGSGDG
jgi:hypothetical protein